MSFTHALSTNRYGESDLIVDSNPAQGTHTTLTSAMAAAVSGQTIFLRTSVTESVTLTAGVNIAAWTGGPLNVPSITGTLTMTTAGTCNISGIRLQTNSAALLAVTGSAASIVNLNNCYLNCTNNSGITFSSSNAASQINLRSCNGDLGTTGILLFAHSGAGNLVFYDSDFTNSGGSSTASTVSGSGVFGARRTGFANPLTTSSTSTATALYSQWDTATQNATCLTSGGSGSHNFYYCSFQSGSASGVSASNTTLLSFCDVVSSNTNAVTGAGTIRVNGISFSGSSNVINPTTQTAGYINLGASKATVQPAFLAYLASTALNKTGNGTAYTLGTDALTEVFDQSSNFNTNGTFTAPVTGRYFFNASAYITGCTIATTFTLNIASSNRNSNSSYTRGASAADFNSTTAAFLDMDAADTATVVVQVVGEAGVTDDILGGATTATSFAGYLVC